jgi:hypothetical protein
MDATAMRVNPGDFAQDRKAYRASARAEVIVFLCSRAAGA